ncbi:hypothetical protein [uncultured Microbacterium sp.]|uniref:hypothetical protein n=1 Tax=uncultured Microbacterium sp. TaxID=191216 RepID=UPI0035CA47CD
MEPRRPRSFTLAERRSGVWEIRTADAALIARLARTDDDEVEVSWQSSIPLPHVYATAEVALTDLVMWESRPRGGTKPIPIPSARPPRV